MAKSTKKNYKSSSKGKLKPVAKKVSVNVAELNYSERKEYIEEKYAPFIVDAQMIFSIWDSGIEYDYKGDRKQVAESIIDSYKKLADYTESTLPQETIYEIQDWDLVRRDIDPDTDEVIGETELEQITSDNTYNFSYLGLVDVNWRVYHDEEYDRYFYVIMPHLGGDIRGNYGDAIILEGNDKEELFYRFYEGFISGGASIYLKFKDGSEVGFDSEQYSDTFSFRVSEVFEPTGMAQNYLEEYEKLDSYTGDIFLEDTIDIYLSRKGIAPKMMAGGKLNDETPMAYIQILGYDEGKWFNLSDYSDGQDVIDGISDWMDTLNYEFGGNREEYEVTDYEGFGDDLYDEYMGANEFEEIIEAYEKYQSSDFPADVISAYKSNSGSRNDSLSDIIDEMDNNFFGKYDSLKDFGYEMVEQGVYEPSDNDVYMTDTDKRIMAGEESDYVVDGMNFEELLNIAKDTQSEYEDEKSELEDKIVEITDEISDLIALLNDNTEDDDEYERISDEIEAREIDLEELENSYTDIDSRYEDKAREEAREVFYDEIYDRLENDLEGWLSDNGYDEDLQNINFLSVDYEKIGDEISSDYLIVEYDGEMYFFNNYAKGGRLVASKRKPKYDFYIVESSTKKLVSGYPTKAEAVEQRKLLVKEYPSMRFEIYTLGNLEAKTNLDVYAKKDYVELSTLDKIKKVSVDAYRYGKEKVGQAQVFLEKNDVKGKIKRGARKVWDKTKQGGNWLKRQWQEADFGDGKGKAKFFADGGGVYNLESDLIKYKNLDIRFKLIPNDGSEEDSDENDLSLNYVGEIYTGGIDNDEPFVELGFQVNNESDNSFNLKSDLIKYKNVDIRFKLIPNDGSEEDSDENDLSLNYVGEIYTGGIDNDEPFVELGFQVNDKYADGGNVDFDKIKKANEIYKEHNLELKEKGIEEFSKESAELWDKGGYDERLKKLNLTYEERINLDPKKWYADGGQPVQYVPVQPVPQQPVQYVPVQQVQQQPNSPMGNLDLNTALNFVKENPQVLAMLENGGTAQLGEVSGMLPNPLPMSTIQPMATGGVADELAYINNRIHNLEELVVTMNEEDKPSIYSTINQLKGERTALMNGGSEIKQKKSWWSFKKGGEAKKKVNDDYDVYDNKRMLQNQANEIEHHSEELNKQVSATKKVPAWVISKMERATTDLSDITHYLDGENKMADGGVAGEVKYEVLPYLNKFIIAKVTYKQHEDYTYPSKDFIYGFNGKFLEFEDMKSAQNFIDNIEPKYPYGIPKANVGMLLMASQLMQQQKQQQPQVVYYVPQPASQTEENTGIKQDIPEMADGGELDDALINDFCITNLIELANEIQPVKYFVTDRFKETDLESKYYKGRLIIVFKEPASVNVVEAITKFIEMAEDCHHILEQSVNVSGSEPTGLSINLLSDRFSDKEFNKGGKVYDYSPKKINIDKTKKIKTILGDYVVGLITNDFVYFVNPSEGDENAQTIMYDKNGNLISDNIFATNDLFETLETQDTFEFIHPDMEAYRQEIINGN